ncbi:MAG TPA: cytochrome c-type biogenesis protein CcmH, partial [Conexibacter sp.]|nr:cytochrome c-type biogenesis protein CcmH [Conexibacter sp.]
RAASRPRVPRARAAVLALLLTGLLATPSAAVEPKTTLPAMEQQVMCAVCRTPLAVANGPQADAERSQIRRLIAQGKSEQQIKDVLVAQYGERVLALPQSDGFNLAVYLVPILVVALALASLAFALPRWRRHARARTSAPAAAVPALSAEDTRRIDEELAQRD